MELSGTIKEIFEPRISEKFKKRELLLAYRDDRYDRMVLLQLLGDKIELLDDFAEGDSVNVHFNADSRKVTKPDDQREVIYTNLTIYRITKI